MTHEPPDRRRHQRSEVVATAVVFSTDRLHGTFLVQDLSAGGACLVGDVQVPPGATVSLLLHFPGHTPFSIEAVVVRHDARGPTNLRTAVLFRNLSAEQEDTIHEEIVAALERESARRLATVLVIEPDGVQRDALERELRALGHEALGVSTPLEALAWLERPASRIETVLVGLAGGSGPQGWTCWSSWASTTRACAGWC